MKEAGRYLWDVRTPMRDGVELSTDVHLPPEGLAGGPYPVVLLRTPANNQDAATVARARRLSESGYGVALQDVRGREDSDGTFRPFVDEGADGYDTVEWLAAQEWCTGKVAMMGAGYSGWASWAAARERPPHLTTLVSTSPWGRWHETGPFRNGAVVLPMLAWLHATSARVWQHAGQVAWEEVLWHLPLRTMDGPLGRDLPLWREWLDSGGSDDYWSSLEVDLSGIDVPVLHVTDWQDDALAAALHLHESMRAHSPAESAVVIGPCDADDLHQRWFDHCLKDGPAVGSAYFLTGTGTWRDEPWTDAGGTARWFLHSGGSARSLAGDGTLSSEPPGDEPADSYTYDPADPVVVTADLVFFPSPPAQRAALPLDRRFVDRRPDVLVYTSPELTGDLELVGRPRLELFAGSDRPDTDWVVSLSDVDPLGASVLLSTGVVRAAWQLERPLHPGDVDAFAIELTAVAHVLRAGHRLRLSVTSSCFPLVDRNLGTTDGSGPVVAVNTVHHDAAHPSHLVLPQVSPRD